MDNDNREISEQSETNEQSNKELALKILREKNSLAMSGGGTLCISHVGQIERWIELGGDLKKIKYLSTASGGSIIGAAIACGASIEFIKEKMFSINYESLKDHSFLPLDLIRFFRHCGWYKGKALSNYIHDLLQTLTGNGEITFKQAYDRYGVCITMNYVSLRYRRTRYANYLTKPDSQIKKYVRGSGGIPFFYELLGDEVMENGMPLKDKIFDGGCVDNFPIHVLHEIGIPNSKILGLTLVSSNEEELYAADIKGELYDQGLPNDPLNLAIVIINFLRNAAMKIHINKEDWKLTSKTNVGKYKSTDFDLTNDDINILFQLGRNGMDQHLLQIKTLLDCNSYPEYN